MTLYCSNNHAQTWKCHEKQPLTCRICKRDAKRAAEKQQKDFELQKKRDADQQAKERDVALKQQEQDVKDAEERLQKKVEAEKERQDEEEKRATEHAAASSSSIATTLIDTFKYAINTLSGLPSKQSPPENTKKKKESEAQPDWQHRKDTDGAANPHIDAIMEMIGLEPVKQQVLRIMDKVDVNVRQGTSLSKERFNAVLLGNPGTGIIQSVPQRKTLTDGAYRKDYCGEALC